MNILFAQRSQKHHHAGYGNVSLITVNFSALHILQLEKTIFPAANILSFLSYLLQEKAVR